MKVSVVIFALSCSIFSGFSQLADSSFLKKMQVVRSTSPEKGLYVNWHITLPGTELFWMPWAEFPYFDESYKKLYMVGDAGFMFSNLGLSVEPRFNVWSNYESAFFVKAPLSFAVSVTAPITTDHYSKSWGVFNASLPVLVGYGNGLNSSGKNISPGGYAFSAGAQLFLCPLVGGSSWGNQVEDRRKWVTPLVGFDHYWRGRKQKIRGFSLLYSPAPFYFKFTLLLASKYYKISE